MTKVLPSCLAVVALMAGGSSDVHAARPVSPIHLVTQATPGGVRVTVVGRSATAFDARFELEVSSVDGGARNQSTQRGDARLRPGVPVTLVNVMMSTGAQGSWTARLKVVPARAAAYQEVRSST